jgi:hypothetical protein
MLTLTTDDYPNDQRVLHSVLLSSSCCWYLIIDMNQRACELVCTLTTVNRLARQPCYCYYCFSYAISNCHYYYWCNCNRWQALKANKASHMPYNDPEELLKLSEEEIAAERSAQTARRWYAAIQYAFEQVCHASYTTSSSQPIVEVNIKCSVVLLQRLDMLSV